jgi:hypothetical protein
MNEAARTRELRMELLRMRAHVQRAEVAAAMRTLRSDTRRLRSFAGAAGSLGAALRGRRDWLGLIAGTITGRPWLASLALGALRALKRKPLLAAIAASALALGIVARGGRRSTADAERDGGTDEAADDRIDDWA